MPSETQMDRIGTMVRGSFTVLENSQLDKMFQMRETIVFSWSDRVGPSAVKPQAHKDQCMPVCDTKTERE